MCACVFFFYYTIYFYYILLYLTCITFCVSAQKIHTSSETFLALIKDDAYELQLRGEIEVKVNVCDSF